MTGPSFAQGMAIRSLLPTYRVGMAQEVRIGMLVPLSGPAMSWGLPGLNGCRIWEDWLNAAGGVLIQGNRYPVRIIARDCGTDAVQAFEGARHLVLSEKVALLMMLGGDSFTPVRGFLSQNKVLTSTLLPSDLSPDTRYLIAPSETHPVYNVTGVDWLARNRPELRRVALCSQSDAFGLPSLATYRVAFRAAGHTICREIRYDAQDTDVAAIVQPMLDSDPDILCWCTSYTPMVHAMTEYAHAHGFKGTILSCTMDQYDQLVARTSVEFMEGTVFQFPDFDDPLLSEKAFFFNQPNTFYTEYNRRFPDSWSAVSWEYAAILDIWLAAVEKVGTLATASVMAAMKQMDKVNHAFGPAKWWGKSLFGIDNALIGDWPVVTIQDGKARIVGFGSVPDWLAQHETALHSEMSTLGQLWAQRQEGGLALQTLAPRQAYPAA
ncbi:ABC transporter substrate-binding protein [Roseinatronobacter alkalisoli]|uniref:ABC transporter substrate-binding protein n=1 Tax=Roseinatronobacter alkalisoli TaxID=3028235 RepID=A0ABT5T6X3_9RHOB|nr:ABC transporter substrate-binding protein [Roseinatronobacter sp. HJB301]MDD7970716.1 ABC transporter substrate-binding protein [Roseinatronobacter sp. HJB301]